MSDRAISKGVVNTAARYLKFVFNLFSLGLITGVLFTLSYSAICSLINGGTFQHSVIVAALLVAPCLLLAGVVTMLINADSVRRFKAFLYK